MSNKIEHDDIAGIIKVPYFETENLRNFSSDSFAIKLHSQYLELIEDTMLEYLDPTLGTWKEGVWQEHSTIAREMILDVRMKKIKNYYQVASVSADFWFNVETYEDARLVKDSITEWARNFNWA